MKPAAESAAEPGIGPEGVPPKALSRLLNVLEVFSSTMLAIMMVLTFVDVVGRYLFSKPIFGASEMISALLAMVIFAGLGIANARDRHIVVELFDHHLRKVAPRLYDLVIQGFSVLAMALIAYVLFDLALDAYHDDARTIVLEIPLVYIIGVIAALAVIGVVAQLAGMVLHLRQHRDDYA